MRCQERDHLEGREATGVLEALQNAGNAVLGLRNEAVDGGDGLVGAASQELELRCTLCGVLGQNR